MVLSRSARLVVVLLLSLLSACASVPIQDFSWQGRFRFEQTGQAPLSAHFRWQRQGPDELLELLTPTGQTLLELHQQGTQVRYQVAGQAPQQVSSIAAALWQWSETLPLDKLPHWLSRSPGRFNDGLWRLNLDIGDNGQVQLQAHSSKEQHLRVVASRDQGAEE